jgi:hypothetical protein
LNDQILQLIDEEIARLQQARALLTESGPADSASAEPGAKPRRQLSPKASRAIAEAQRKRWEKVHSRANAATPPPAAE